MILPELSIVKAAFSASGGLLWAATTLDRPDPSPKCGVGRIERQDSHNEPLRIHWRRFTLNVRSCSGTQLMVPYFSRHRHSISGRTIAARDVAGPLRTTTANGSRPVDTTAARHGTIA
jgi:hypothetical protein